MFDKTKINYTEILYWLKEYKKSTDVRYKKQLQKIIVVACMPLVKMIAKNLARRSSDPVEDIIQVGSVGLVKAIHFYNPEISDNFKTYVTYLITGEIRHYLRDKVAMIRQPREIYELTYRVNQIMQNLQNGLDEEPTEAYLANELDVSEKRVHDVMSADRRKQMMSFEQLMASTNDIESSILEKMASNNYYNLEKFQEDKIIISDAIDQLNEKLQQVIIMSFYEDMSQSQIAEELGISQMQVSRRLKVGLKTLLRVLTNNEKKKEQEAKLEQQEEEE